MLSSDMFSSQQPRLLVFAGPNGSGKSTVTAGIEPIGIYVNADQIQADSGCSTLDAAIEAEQIREMLLKARADFTFETVLSTDRNLKLLQRAKEAGYDIFAVFVLTKDPAINIKRVRERAAAGGHDVPEDKIVSRYYKSLDNLKLLVRIADRTLVIDNSGETPAVICEVVGKSATIRPADDWTEEAILALIAEP